VRPVLQDLLDHRATQDHKAPQVPLVQQDPLVRRALQVLQDRRDRKATQDLLDHKETPDPKARQGHRDPLVLLDLQV